MGVAHRKALPATRDVEMHVHLASWVIFAKLLKQKPKRDVGWLFERTELGQRGVSAPPARQRIPELDLGLKPGMRNIDAKLIDPMRDRVRKDGPEMLIPGT